jgi:MFS family permease
MLRRSAKKPGNQVTAAVVERATRTAVCVGDLLPLGQDGRVPDRITLANAPSAIPSLWRHRPFLLLWGGQTVSEVGSQVTLLVLPLIAVTLLGASTFEVTLLTVLDTAPLLLLSLLAGVVADRVRRRPLMLWCTVGRMVLLASVPIAGWMNGLTLAHLYVVAAAAGVLSVFFDVAYQSYIPTLVEPEQLVDGYGKLGTTQSFARLAGPSLGG